MRKGHCIGRLCIWRQLRRLEEGRELRPPTWIDADGYCERCGRKNRTTKSGNPSPATPRSQASYDGPKPHDPWG